MAEAAKIGKPTRLPEPPTADQTKDNLEPGVKLVTRQVKVKVKGFTGPPKQLNIRIDPAKHQEIKVAATMAGVDMGEYLMSIYDKHREQQGA